MEKITAFASKYRNWLIGSGILLLIVILYFSFKNDGDEVDDKGAQGECPSSFSINTTVGITAGIVETNYFILDGKYYKQLSAGIAGASGQLPKREITKEEFLSACKTYKTPQTGSNPA